MGVEAVDFFRLMLRARRESGLLAEMLSHRFLKKSGGFDRLTFSVHEGVHAVGGGEKFIAALDLVVHAYADERLFQHTCDDGDYVIVVGRPLVLDVDFEDGEKEALGFDFLVGKSFLAEQLGTADLHPREVVAMIDNAHHVGFGIEYLNFCDAF